MINDDTKKFLEEHKHRKVAIIYGMETHMLSFGSGFLSFFLSFHFSDQDDLFSSFENIDLDEISMNHQEQESQEWRSEV